MDQPNPLSHRQLLRSHTPETPSSWPVVGQFSSIGSLGLKPTDWLTTEWSTSFAGRGARGIRLVGAHQSKITLTFFICAHITRCLETMHGANM